jgi:hypothetical protein
MRSEVLGAAAVDIAGLSIRRTSSSKKIDQ